MRFKRCSARPRYNWNDPLNVRSYQDWHDGLADKQDDVTTVTDQSVYRVHTAACNGRDCAGNPHAADNGPATRPRALRIPRPGVDGDFGASRRGRPRLRGNHRKPEHPSRPAAAIYTCFRTRPKLPKPLPVKNWVRSCRSSQRCTAWVPTLAIPLK